VQTVAVTNWTQWRGSFDAADYDERWRRMEEAGQNPHGEADLVTSYRPQTVLDAGCGTGRVAIELHRRGIEVVGVDLDADMLAIARTKAPELAWVHADLSRLELLRRFDVVVMAGNVMRFVEPDRRADAVAGCARHLTAGGRVIAGWQLDAAAPSLADYDDWCAAANLTLEERFATWDRATLIEPGEYAVSVHRARRSTADVGPG
jgi:SAM-dependent methyltransferase